jgi:peptidoglycan/LPS O-acetylase OafA/YrhL
MPRAHSGVLPRATLSRRGRATLAILLVLAFAPTAAWAEGPIARSARMLVATRAPELSRLAAQQQVRAARRRGPGRIVAGAAVGATAGLFAGGYLGAVIDGGCGGCDDPGFKGALIGMPIGAVAGGILGGKFLF